MSQQVVGIGNLGNSGILVWSPHLWAPTRPAVNWGKQIIWFFSNLFLKLHKRISNDIESYNINHINILNIARSATDLDLKWVLFSLIDSVCQIFSFIITQSRQIWKRLPAVNSRKAFNSCGHGEQKPLLKESSEGFFLRQIRYWGWYYSSFKMFRLMKCHFDSEAAFGCGNAEYRRVNWQNKNVNWLFWIFRFPAEPFWAGHAGNMSVAMGHSHRFHSILKLCDS